MGLAGAIGFAEREAFARRGRQLELLTVGWGACEAAVALYAASRSGSISLTGFGLDSLIEMISAVALLWRMTHEMDHHRKHEAERISLRIAGWCLLALGAYVLVAATYGLWTQGDSPGQFQAGWLGIAVTSAALVCMPLLARAKRRVGRGLGSTAMLTDATQTDFCMYQAAIVLFGLAMHRAFGIAWADAAAALLLVPLLVRAGVLALNGVNCCGH